MAEEVFPRAVYHKDWKETRNDKTHFRVVHSQEEIDSLPKDWGLHPDGPFRKRAGRRRVNGGINDSPQTDPGQHEDDRSDSLWGNSDC